MAPLGRLAGLLGQVRHSRQAAGLYRRRYRFLVDRSGQGKGAGRQIQERQLTFSRPRRDFLALAGAAAASTLLPGKAFASTPTGLRLHGLSAFGDLKYKADFPHFAYVNPEAPKGG